jgi:hypothetical protein
VARFDSEHAKNRINFAFIVQHYNVEKCTIIYKLFGQMVPTPKEVADLHLVVSLSLVCGTVLITYIDSDFMGPG